MERRDFDKLYGTSTENGMQWPTKIPFCSLNKVILFFFLMRGSNYLENEFLKKDEDNK